MSSQQRLLKAAIVKWIRIIIINVVWVEVLINRIEVCVKGGGYV